MSVKKIPMIVCLSGGLTSAYMSHWLKENMSHKYDFTFVFANTGAEHEKTLEFVNNCDLFFNLKLNWLEAEVHHEYDVGTTHKFVSFETASRKGEPFKEMVKKFGIPNMDFPHCNRELKIRPMESFMKSKSIKYRSIGIRNDEFERATKQVKKKNPSWSVEQILKYKYETENIYYPLILDEPISRGSVVNWWSKMPFNLEIREHEGNCVSCWKKSDRKLWTLAKEDESNFDIFRSIEDEYGSFHPPTQTKRSGKQVFYRGYRSCEEIIKQSGTENFTMFTEDKSFQPSLFNCGIDEDFSCSECGTIF